jgi:hypothetical protein
MRWKSWGVIAVLTVVFGTGCTGPTVAPPVPVSPPYSGYTTTAGAVDIYNTVKYVYGCSTTGSTIWASINQWPNAGDPVVDDVDVGVYSGYYGPLQDLPPVLGSANFVRAQPSGDVVHVSPGQCFTVFVDAREENGFQPAGTVTFTLNW